MQVDETSETTFPLPALLQRTSQQGLEQTSIISTLNYSPTFQHHRIGREDGSGRSIILKLLFGEVHSELAARSIMTK